MLKEFAYSKIIKFYISLFVITIFFGIFVIYKCKKKVDIIESGKKIKSKTIIDEILNFYVNYFYIFYLGFALFTFISSICHYVINPLNKEIWNNIIMAEIIYFKVIDFQILTATNFFEDTNFIARGTLFFITLEKLLWMIIETLIYNFVKNLKYLVLVQIIVTSIGVLYIIAIIIDSIRDCF